MPLEKALITWTGTSLLSEVLRWPPGSLAGWHLGCSYQKAEKNLLAHFPLFICCPGKMQSGAAVTFSRGGSLPATLRCYNRVWGSVLPGVRGGGPANQPSQGPSLPLPNSPMAASFGIPGGLTHPLGRVWNLSRGKFWVRSQTLVFWTHFPEVGAERWISHGANLNRGRGTEMKPQTANVPKW